MELVDRLLTILAGPNRSTATSQLMETGYTEDEVRGAWNFARSDSTETYPAGNSRLDQCGEKDVASMPVSHDLVGDVNPDTVGVELNGPTVALVILLN